MLRLGYSSQNKRVPMARYDGIKLLKKLNPRNLCVREFIKTQTEK